VFSLNVGAKNTKPAVKLAKIEMLSISTSLTFVPNQRSEDAQNTDSQSVAAITMELLFLLKVNVMLAKLSRYISLELAHPNQTHNYANNQEFELHYSYEYEF
jgi:hypothetical protein